MASKAYFQGYNAETLRSHTSRTVDNTCGFFINQVHPNSHVLDAGCGPGTITSSFAAVIPQGSIIGIDISDEVVGKANEQKNLPRNCSFQQANLTKLPFPDNTFDVIYTSQTLVHIPDRIAALGELRRVCKPGGFVACREGDLVGTMIHPRHPGLELWQKAALESMRHNTGGDRAAREILSWALEAGFSDDNVKLGLGALMYSGEEQRTFWGQTMMDRVKTDEVFRSKAKACGAIKSDDEFETIIAGWAAFVEDPAAVFIMPCGEIICHK